MTHQSKACPHGYTDLDGACISLCATTNAQRGMGPMNTAHLFATCRDDHAATPAECRADMLALLERTTPPAAARVDRDIAPPHGYTRPIPSTVEAGIR